MNTDLEGVDGIFIGILIVVLIGTIASAAQIYKTRGIRKRSLDLKFLATRLGFTFNPNRDEGFAMGWGFLDKLAQGSERYAFNILRGKHKERPVFVFDYHYQSISGKRIEDHYLTILMLVVQEVFPQVTIKPESLLSKAAAVLGFENIKFESAEFSRLFCVRSQDKRFAYDVCNPQMIEYLLPNRDLEIEIQGPVVLLAFEKQLSAQEIDFNLRRLFEIRLRLPEYLFSQKAVQSS